MNAKKCVHSFNPRDEVLKRSTNEAENTKYVNIFCKQCSISFDRNEERIRR